MSIFFVTHLTPSQLNPPDTNLVHFSETQLQLVTCTYLHHLKSTSGTHTHKHYMSVQFYLK